MICFSMNVNPPKSMNLKINKGKLHSFIRSYTTISYLELDEMETNVDSFILNERVH